MQLEDFLRPTQKQLFFTLRQRYGDKAVCQKGAYLLVQGEAPVMLIAHLDTVHKQPVRDICKSICGNILMSPQGIGGDDRCGVYALTRIYGQSSKKPWLLFTCDEENGGIGAHVFCENHTKGKLPESLSSLKFLVELDRRGNRDAVYYDCGNDDFEEYITSKGFQTAQGSFSDISLIAPKLGVAAVNLSSGYYDAHTLHEHINVEQLEVVIEKVANIVAEAAEDTIPRFEYRERPLEWDCWEDCILPRLPQRYMDIYEELLCLYHPEELEAYRRTYGNRALLPLYEKNFGSLHETEHSEK